ncbi:carbohydrate ABC transporter permease [Microlunatus sp. GCM10028923]|uniref:carbohydrate ABC transporter permease n=1 Tax=Microlunatus sp. GCM10028923 TaxID=3273400 RepID=UPI00361143FF
MTRQPTALALRARRGPLTIVGYLYLVILLIFFGLPIVYAVLTAFQPRSVTNQPMPQWLFTPTLDNFRSLFEEYSFIGPLLNSLQSSLGSALVALIIAAPAAYALSRSRMGRSRAARLGWVGFWLLGARALPAIGLAIPAYAIFNEIGLNDTIVAMLIVYLPYNVALATILLKVFLDGVPMEIDEAAAVDGAGPFRTLWSVILPLSRPGAASVMIMTFLFGWNNFLFPLVLTGSRAGTIPLALQQFLGSYTLQWNQVMAGVVLLSLPLILLAVLFGKYMIGGLTAGSIK